jgi:Family of unknown function (DUF6785)/Domain of unknown function (DUF6784)
MTIPPSSPSVRTHHRASPPTAVSSPTAAPIRPRAFVIGAALVALLGAFQPYMELVLHSFYTGLGSLPATPLVALLVLLAVGAWVGRRLGPRFALSRAELLLIYTMLLVAAQLPHGGGLPYIVSATVYPFYFATEGNGWAGLFHEAIPRFLRLNDEVANQGFYRGLPPGAPIPWGPWLLPLAAWTLFSLLMYGAFFSLAVLLRRDWIERQRLTFPLAELPLALVAEGPGGGSRGFFRNPRMWMGFALAATLVVLDWLHRLIPAVPEPVLRWEIGKNFENAVVPWNVLSDMMLNLNPAIIGVVLLVPGEVALSIWLFYVLYRVQLVGYASAGLTAGEGAALFAPETFIHHQEAGGFLMLAAALLWQSRGALRRTFRSVVSPDEAETPRWPLWGFLACNAGLAAWAWAAGAQIWAFLLIMTVYYVMALVITRLVAAGGVMFVDTGFFPRGLLTGALGGGVFSTASLTLFAYLQTIFYCDPMFCTMPHQMTGLRLGQTQRLSDRVMGSAMFVGLIVMFLCALPALLIVIYHHGAASLGRWPLTSYASWQFGELATVLNNPPKLSWWTHVGLGSGAAIMLGLIQMHQRFLWWGVSPIGYVIASSFETNRSLWANAFAGWLLGAVITRYGGLRLYGTWRPAFIGLILGSFVAGALTSVLTAMLGVSAAGG